MTAFGAKRTLARQAHQPQNGDRNGFVLNPPVTSIFHVADGRPGCIARAAICEMDIPVPTC